MRFNNVARFLTTVLVVGITINQSLAQCPAEVSNLPSDITINTIQDLCEAPVTWTPPTYELDCSNFSGLFDESNWTLNTNGANGSLDNSLAPNSLAISGSQNGTSGVITSTELCISIPVDGLMSFDWAATMSSNGAGVQLLNDEPGVSINGVDSILLVNPPAGVGINNENGSVTDLELQEGDQFCFLVRSNNIVAFTTTVFSNFQYTITEINQTAGPSIGDVLPPDVYTIEYEVVDCDDVVSTCTFDITIEDNQNPTIDCPSTDVTMDADSSRCTAVVCFDIEADDNCDISAPTSIPGHIFIGSFNGHSYFVSPLFGTRTWEDAHNVATNLGGHLVSITSQAEQDFINNNIGFGLYWIGLRYSPSLDSFKWTSGEDVTYTDWGIGQPGFISGDYVFQLDFGGSFADGWYDIPGGTTSRYIIEIEDGPRIELLDGLASGSNYPVGITSVEYRAVDEFGNADSCTFNVVVSDVEAPIITCPTVADVQLRAGQCDSVITYAFPLATDNCALDRVEQIDGTGLTSGDAFGIGTTILEYHAVDTSNNADTCNITINVLEYQVQELVCTNINLSLDNADCTGSITLDMIGNNDLGCPDSCRIEVKDEHGNVIPNSFDFTHINEEFEYSLFCGGNSCWGRVTIEDYVRPTVGNCLADTISCVESLDVARRPTAEDNCMANIVLVDDVYEKINCDDVVLGKYTRRWIAVDLAGNVSTDTCVQEVFVARTNLSGIVFPTNRTGANALECNSFVPLNNGAPNPSLTGVPTLNGVALYPFNASVICNGFVKFEDDVKTFSNDCKTLVQRRWTIGEWHCDSIARMEFIQMLEIVDRIDPVVSAPADITVSVNGHDCNADVVIDPAVVSDNCSEISEIYISTGSGVINNNGGQINLPVGLNTIVYFAKDACGNLGTDTMEVMVRDLLEPVALCETYTTVSVLNTGSVWLSAESIDDGSFDNCTDVEIEIRRMTDPCGISGTAFADEVAFCCADVGANQMVVLRVTDEGGNTNECMVEVEVQDKNLPVITCPNDLTVNCEFTYDINDPATYFDSVDYTGTACPGNLEVKDEITAEELDVCRTGYLEREIEISFNGEVLRTCHQTITFETNNPLTYNQIVWPLDYTSSLECTEQDLEPENLPDGFDRPDVPDGFCNLVGIEKEDKVYNFAGNGACFKIIRTWTVIDWCGSSLADTIPTYSREQVIVVNNSVAPTITSADTLVSICSYNADCNSVPITLTASATDDCTPTNELQWDYVITLEDGSTINGIGNDASGLYPIGTHYVDYEVRDKCGNIQRTGYPFEIRNCKAPTAYCLSGLSTALVGMDTIGNDSIPDAEMAVLKPEFFDNGSAHDCGYPVTLSFSSDLSDTLLILDCNDIGRVDVELWVTDINGNSSFCSTFVDVIDSNDVDICMPRQGLVNGKVESVSGDMIAGVQVELSGGEARVETTDGEGYYTFGQLPFGENYNIVPSKDGDDMNGVSTLDLILIQRHILEMAKFDNPYVYIAADVNKDDRISSSDLVELRKLILGVNTEFTHNTSWRFVDKSQVFDLPSNPWYQSIQENYLINNLDSDMEIEFVGAKIGDVNFDALTNFQGQIPSSRNASKSLSIDNVDLRKGEKFEYNIKLDKVNNLNGFQFELDINSHEILALNANWLNAEDYHWTADKLIVSYNNTNREVIPNTEFVINVVAESHTDGKLNEVMNLNQNRILAEVYSSDLAEIDYLKLRWNEAESTLIHVSEVEPNPWSNRAAIEIVTYDTNPLEFSIFSATGKLVNRNSLIPSKGVNKIELSSEDFDHSGIYFITIEGEGYSITKKMIVLD